MPRASRRHANDIVTCPHCERVLSFVATWSSRGLWGYKEVQTYECSEHGPIFVSPQRAVVRISNKRSHQGYDTGDRDSLVWARRWPRPTLDAGAIALPEPDSD